MHPALRSAIAFNMKAIVAQKLLPSIKPGVGRVPTVEIMTFNATVRKLILEEQDEKLGDLIRMSAREGMQDFTMSLKRPRRPGFDRPGRGVGSGAERGGAEDGTQRHRRFATWNSLMVRLFRAFRPGDSPPPLVCCWPTCRRRWPTSALAERRRAVPARAGRLSQPAEDRLLCWLLFLLWVRTTDWLNQDVPADCG